MIFQRDNLKSKKNYYLVLITIEIIAYIALFYTSLHWFFLILIFPFLIIEIISNKRCLDRQKNFVEKIEFKDQQLICNHINKSQTLIDFESLAFSFREIKFEKDKSEIEIKKKGKFRNKLIGRIHIDNWKNIFDIKNEFLKNEIVRVKFKPEGFWSKYGGLTADIVIITSGLAVGEISDITGDTQGASDIRYSTSQSDFNSLHKNHQNKASE